MVDRECDSLVMVVLCLVDGRSRVWLSGDGGPLSGWRTQTALNLDWVRLVPIWRAKTRRAVLKQTEYGSNLQWHMSPSSFHLALFVTCWNSNYIYLVTYLFSHLAVACNDTVTVILSHHRCNFIHVYLSSTNVRRVSAFLATNFVKMYIVLEMYVYRSSTVFCVIRIASLSPLGNMRYGP